MKHKRIISLIMLLTMLLIFVIPAYAKAKPKISKKSVTITVGKTLKLSVKKAKKVKWSSSNKKIATVNKKGIVTAKSVGNAVITAKVGKKKLKCSVIVKRFKGEYHTEKGKPRYYDYRTKNSLFNLKIDIVGNELFIEGQLVRHKQWDDNKPELVKGNKHIFILSSKTKFWSGDTIISKKRFLTEAKAFKTWMDRSTRGLLIDMEDGKVVSVGWW